MIPLHARLIAAGCALVAVLGLLAYMGHLRKEVAQQRLRAETAEAAAAMRQVETKVIERFHTETKIIHEQGEREAEALQQLPGATNEIAPDRRLALCSMLSRMRDNEPACSPDPRGAEPAPEVRAGEGGSPPDAG